MITIDYAILNIKIINFNAVGKSSYTILLRDIQWLSSFRLFMDALAEILHEELKP